MQYIIPSLSINILPGDLTDIAFMKPLLKTLAAVGFRYDGLGYQSFRMDRQIP